MIGTPETSVRGTGPGARPTIVLDRVQTRSALDLSPIVAILSSALIAISRNEVSAPPRIAARSAAGLLGTMPAWVPGVGLAAKVVSVFPASGANGHSAHEGVVALFDEETGAPLALMNASELTAVRTAAVATVSMHALANAHPAKIAVVGSGVQARAQLAILSALEPGIPVVVGGRNQALATWAAAGHPNGSSGPIEAAVKDADVIFCCTGSRTPVLKRSWIAEGAHVSSVGGSDGHELDADTIQDGSLFVEWGGAVTSPPPSGAHELQGMSEQDATLLGSVLGGSHPGRTRASELTVFKSTGHAAFDVAAASVVYDIARIRGIGSAIDL
jgi:ornithine cyclodeaminase/alanine dehydrogenase-like protein (mu-crystallin family)